MFTGIIEELGMVHKFHPRGGGARLTVRCAQVLPQLSEGASIAVNGVCLTALQLTDETFSADLAPETLQRSNLGDLVTGAPVNLERPVTPATLLSGHIVQGHVDATGELVSLDPLGGGNWWLKVRLPPELDRYLVEKGSIALDGISLTIARLEIARVEAAKLEFGRLDYGRSQAPRLETGPVVGVTIIPHTFANTTLGSARVGSRINVEADVLAKHIEKLLAGRLGES